MARAVPMVRVEVEETVVRPAGAPEHPRGREPTGRPPRPGHALPRHVGRWFAVAAVVALGLAGTQAALDAHERTVDARLARVAGAAQRLDAPPQPAWTAQGPAAVVLAQRLVADGVAVGVLTLGDGSRDVAAYDLARGHRRWLVTIDPADDLRAQTEAPRATASCQLLPGAPARVACVTTDQVATYSDGTLYVTHQAHHGHLVVLDVATGRRLVDRPTAPSPVFAVFPDLVVLAQAGLDARTHVVAEDLTTGAVRWRYTSPAHSLFATGEPFLRLFAVGDEAVLLDASGTATVLTAAGAARRPTGRPLLGWSADATGGLWLLTGAAIGSGDATAGTVVVRPGRADLVLPGRGAPPVVDDGSLPGLVVSSGRAGTRGGDAVTGRVRWTSPVEGQPAGSLVLGGRLVLVTASGVTALDGSDGTTDWATPADEDAAVTALSSDGRHVLAVEEADGGATLVALRASDGRVQWRAPLPPGDVRVLGRALVVIGAASATRMAP